jgi:hypothetical protein
VKIEDNFVVWSLIQQPTACGANVLHTPFVTATADPTGTQWIQGTCSYIDLPVKTVRNLRGGGWDASCCVIIIGKEVNHQSQLYVFVKILPEDGPYRPKHVVMIQA